MENNFNHDLFDKDYIEHHGILGMKWGVKNGPPYPLGSAISTGSRLIKTARKNFSTAERTARRTINKTKRRVERAANTTRKQLMKQVNATQKQIASVGKTARKTAEGAYKSAQKTANDNASKARKYLENQFGSIENARKYFTKKFGSADKARQYLQKQFGIADSQVNQLKKTVRNSIDEGKEYAENARNFVNDKRRQVEDQVNSARNFVNDKRKYLGNQIDNVRNIANNARNTAEKTATKYGKEFLDNAKNTAEAAKGEAAKYSQKLLNNAGRKNVSSAANKNYEKAVQEYNKRAKEWSDKYDNDSYSDPKVRRKADAEWNNEVKPLYEKTGKNLVERVINNTKNDIKPAIDKATQGYRRMAGQSALNQYNKMQLANHYLFGIGNKEKGIGYAKNGPNEQKVLDEINKSKPKNTILGLASKKEVDAYNKAKSDNVDNMLKATIKDLDLKQVDEDTLKYGRSVLNYLTYGSNSFFMKNGSNNKVSTNGASRNILGGIKNTMNSVSKDNSDKKAIENYVNRETKMGKNALKVANKINSDYQKSSEYKEYKKMSDEIDALVTKNPNQLFDQMTVNKYNALEKKATDKYNSILKDSYDDMALAVVADLNLEDVSPSTLEYTKKLLKNMK